jgi:hypothetical protein
VIYSGGSKQNVCYEKTIEIGQNMANSIYKISQKWRGNKK